MTLTKRNQSRMQSELRRCRIDVSVNKSEVKIDRLFSGFKVPRTYQLYRGGVEYAIPVVSRELKNEAFIYQCFNEKGSQLFTYVIDWNLKEIIFRDKSLEIDGVIEETRISSNNLFDSPAINGRFRLDYIK